jgi:L-seryl-tRNA(Ser) seleniumtransferase
VDVIARRLAHRSELPHAVCVDIAREAVAAGDPDSVEARAVQFRKRLLGPVINATGVLLHTNLGRAPVPRREAVEEVRWANLEFDLLGGRRGDRRAHAASLLARLTGAEAGLVVNNGAAAILLVLAATAAGRPVIVSRGELVEIGGGFRVPDVLRQSGAELVEVGTTNRTHLRDYTDALVDRPGAVLLKVHPSNYAVTGFTRSVEARDLVGLGAPVIADLGSGLLDAATPWLPGRPPRWLNHEPAARQTLSCGVDAVTFSGDKLLGGPQAGIILGSSAVVERCARHPLARALRPGGLVLAALQDTALAYLRRDLDALPFWRMASVPIEELRRRSEALGVGAPVDCESVPGGGSAPGATIPSAGIALDGDHTAALREATEVPVIARVAGGRTILDLRTVDPADDAHLAKAVAAL